MHLSKKDNNGNSPRRGILPVLSSPKSRRIFQAVFHSEDERAFLNSSKAESHNMASLSLQACCPTPDSSRRCFELKNPNSQQTHPSRERPDKLQVLRALGQPPFFRARRIGFSYKSRPSLVSLSGC